jgi:hypothetical protein
MRSHARRKLELAAAWQVVGTSQMMVVAGSHGFDDEDLTPGQQPVTALAPAAAA